MRASYRFNGGQSVKGAVVFNTSLLSFETDQVSDIAGKTAAAAIARPGKTKPYKIVGN
jgi:hypothetical protein